VARLIPISNVALAVGVSETRLRTLCDKALIPFERVGPWRVFRTQDLDAIRKACVNAGYLTAEPQQEVVANGAG
jgi:hypothetical protein